MTWCRQYLNRCWLTTRLFENYTLRVTATSSRNQRVIRLGVFLVQDISFRMTFEAETRHMLQHFLIDCRPPWRTNSQWGIYEVLTSFQNNCWYKLSDVKWMQDDVRSPSRVQAIHVLAPRNMMNNMWYKKIRNNGYLYSIIPSYGVHSTRTIGMNCMGLLPDT